MARQSRAATVLLTRPAPQAQRFAQELHARLGPISVLLSPLMHTVAQRPALPDRPFAALILTSETGAQAAARLRQDGQLLPNLAFCVGNRTAEAAREAGFNAVSADGDVLALETLILARKPDGPLLHLVGEHRAGNLTESLTVGGLETISAIVYAQQPCPLTPEAIALFHQTAPVLVPLFSPRSAMLLQQALPPDRIAPLWIVAISPAAAQKAAALAPARLVTASHPDGENMLLAVAALLSADANA